MRETIKGSDFSVLNNPPVPIVPRKSIRTIRIVLHSTASSPASFRVRRDAIRKDNNCGNRAQFMHGQDQTIERFSGPVQPVTRAENKYKTSYQIK